MQMVSTAIRRATANRLRSNTTPHERKLWRALKEIPVEGTHFRRQAPIGPYVVDFFLSSRAPDHRTRRRTTQRGRHGEAWWWKATLAWAGRIPCHPVLEFRDCGRADRGARTDLCW